MANPKQNPLGFSLIREKSIHDNSYRQGIELFCSVPGCDAKERIVGLTMAQISNEQFISRRVRNQRWELGKDRAHDKCPACVKGLPLGAPRAPVTHYEPGNDPNLEKPVLKPIAPALRALADSTIAAGNGPVKPPMPVDQRKRMARQADLAVTLLDNPRLLRQAEEVTQAVKALGDHPDETPPVKPAEIIPPKLEKTTQETPVNAEAPRSMSREEKKIVYAKLLEVYLDENRGYSSGWTDKRVAEDLGVPQAWVAKIRDEDFGPENNNEEVKLFVAEVEKLRSEFNAHMALATDMQTRLRDLEKMAKRVKEQYR